MNDQTTAAPALKEIFDRARMHFLADETKAIWPAFDSDRFYEIATTKLDDLGIMQRMRQVAEAFDATLPKDFAQALAILTELAPRIQHGFAAISLCEFVVLRGMDDFERSMEALKLFTRYGSAEFAIRPFLLREPERVLAIMRVWAEDENEHVRRLASEGSRPRLPWSFQLKAVVADPSLSWPILDRIRADPSLYVRKSVANHLNDIGKDHPDWLTERLEGWPREDARTVWIVKHALRSLIKQGEPRALAMIGANGKAHARVEEFSVVPATLKLGERLTITARLVSTSEEAQRLMVDYAVHYVKKNGSASKKVFKLKAFDLAPGAAERLAIGQTVRDFTTRTHHAGVHRVDLIANGQTVAQGQFVLEK